MADRKSLVLVGGGGHCLSVINVLEQLPEYEIVAVLDLAEKAGSTLLSTYRIEEEQQTIFNYIHKGYEFIITIGQIKTAKPRQAKFDWLVNNKAPIATIISPAALVSQQAQIGIGTIIMHYALVNADVIIGKNNIINNQANIEHSVQIGDHCHISTGAIINGDCKIGNQVFIGSNTVIKNGVEIADEVIVGAGSYVSKSILQPGIYSGNPCILLKK